MKLLGDSGGIKYRPFIVFKANPSKIPETEEENKRLRYGFGKQIWRDIGVVHREQQLEIYGNLKAPDRVKVSKWVSMIWDELSSTTIANGYKKAFGLLLDDADIAEADLIENLSRHCAIDADIGEVDSDDDIEVNEVDEE
ncbi:hypothetical protein PC116_g12534 [Phytophthora cactorum]|nr:hypothetical protein PC116_g12534 [Phytophthora cactorum]